MNFLSIILSSMLLNACASGYQLESLPPVEHPDAVVENI